MKTYLAIYLVLGLMTMIFMATNYEFLEGTPWWRKVISVVCSVVLWPVIILTLIAQS